MCIVSTGGTSVENLGNVLGNRTQAWSHHLKKAKSLNLQCFSRNMSKVSRVFYSWGGPQLEGTGTGTRERAGAAAGAGARAGAGFDLMKCHII